MNICDSKSKKGVQTFVPGRLYMPTTMNDTDVRICVKVYGQNKHGYTTTLQLYSLKDGTKRNTDVDTTMVKYIDVTDDYCLQKVGS
jgi:hypothetical protein